MVNFDYCKVACSNMSRLEVHAGFFKSHTKGTFYPYALVTKSPN